MQVRPIGGITDGLVVGPRGMVAGFFSIRSERILKRMPPYWRPAAFAISTQGLGQLKVPSAETA
jgi:hypothetical protein